MIAAIRARADSSARAARIRSGRGPLAGAAGKARGAIAAYLPARLLAASTRAPAAGGPCAVDQTGSQSAGRCGNVRSAAAMVPSVIIAVAASMSGAR